MMQSSFEQSADHEEGRMRSVKTVVLGAVMVAAVGGLAQAQLAPASTPITTHERRDIRQDHRDIVRDRHEVRSDSREITSDRHDVRQDVRQGEYGEARRDLRDLQADRVDDRRDKRDVVSDHRDIRQDRRQYRRTVK
jgi:Spy/CpxP family protein refolding chaperone